jgi:hypothetical protein
MSYIVARNVDQLPVHGVDYGFGIRAINFEDRDKNTLDNNLDDEILPFVLGVIEKIDELEEGQALVIWKEIF